MSNANILNIPGESFVPAIQDGRARTFHKVLEKHDGGATVHVEHAVVFDAGFAARFVGIFYIANDLEPAVACLSYGGEQAPGWELLVVRDTPLSLDGMGWDATELLATAMIGRHLGAHLRFDGEGLVHHVRQELLGAVLPEAEISAGTASRL